MSARAGRIVDHAGPYVLLACALGWALAAAGRVGAQPAPDAGTTDEPRARPALPPAPAPMAPAHAAEDPAPRTGPSSPGADVPGAPATDATDPGGAAPSAAPEPAPFAVPPEWLLPPTASPEYSARATATRAPAEKEDAPATVLELERIEIDRHASLTTDGVLRSLPSVATFRRSSSLVADPSSQGLNLRGLAPSGVSRSLVLLDGVPQNDPFGGWVYWRALPKLDLDRIEILHGGGSALYGSAALGGVVQMYSRPTAQMGVDLDAAYGNLDTLTFGGRVAHEIGTFGAALEGEYLRSDGYRIVAPGDRGPIDGETPSEHGNAMARVALAITPKLRLLSRSAWFREVQSGGTRFTRAEITQGSANVGLQYDAGEAGQVELLLFGRRGSFGQVRARVAVARASEERASRQNTPSGDEGGSLTWTSPEITGFGRHRVVAGFDARHVGGESTDRIDPAQRMPDSVVEKSAGGEQWSLGAFAQDVVRFGEQLDVQATLRGDIWRNYAGERTIVRANDARATFESEARTAATISPRLGVLVHVLPWLQLQAAGYRAFRAPTLNELYRSFQVGTILTAANERLGPEHLLGGELGLELLSSFGARLRLTGFLNHLDDPITNASLPAPLPDGSTRQRQNLGSARVHGLELDARWRFGRRTRLAFAYTWAHSEVTDAGPMRAVLGKRLPQDPEHRATVGFIFHHPAWLTSLVQLRMIGPQYEDDLNTSTLSGYALLDVTVSRVLAGGWELYAAGENLLDSTYLVGRAGVDTLGAPFTFRIGIRVRAPQR